MKYSMEVPPLWATAPARMVALIIALSLPALGVGLELTNDDATGAPGKFAADEIRREAAAKGMTIGADSEGTRVVLTVGKEVNAAGQSCSILVGNEGGRRMITVRGADGAGAMWCKWRWIAVWMSIGSPGMCLLVLRKGKTGSLEELLSRLHAPIRCFEKQAKIEVKRATT